MKLCPICKKGYILESESECKQCRMVVPPLPEDGTFTFTNRQTTLRGIHGYNAYNSKGEWVGIVFPTGDKRSPSYNCCELCFFDKYHLRYGEWHRITSHGQRIKWEFLCRQLNTYGKYECYVDEWSPAKR